MIATPTPWALSLPEAERFRLRHSKPGPVRTASSSVLSRPAIIGTTKSEIHFPIWCAKRQATMGPSGNATVRSLARRSRLRTTGSSTEQATLGAVGFAVAASHPASRSFARHCPPSGFSSWAGASGGAATGFCGSGGGDDSSSCAEGRLGGIGCAVACVAVAPTVSTIAKSLVVRGDLDGRTPGLTLIAKHREERLARRGHRW